MPDRLIDLIADTINVPPGNLTEASSINNTPEWDSLAGMELLSVLENTFGVELTITELRQLFSVQNIRAILRNKGVADV